MLVTFDVCDVSALKPVAALMPALDARAACHALLGGGDNHNGARVEQVGAFSPDARVVVVNSRHALAQAAHDAFYAHVPLVLT
ncbi:MAG TPA: hypothetical protein VGO62_12955, partial [Myxococcota bacterium]